MRQIYPNYELVHWYLVCIQNITPAFDTHMSHNITNLQQEAKFGMTRHLRISIMNWQFTAKV